MGSSSHPTKMAHGMDNPFLKNGLGGGLSMPKGPHTQSMGPIRPVNANYILSVALRSLHVLTVSRIGAIDCEIAYLRRLLLR